MMVSISHVVVMVIFLVPALLSFCANIYLKVGKHVDSSSEKLFYVFITFSVTFIIGLLIMPWLVWGSGINPNTIIYPFLQGVKP